MSDGAPDELITVGEIVAPHGVRGEVKVVLTTDFPERFAEGKTIAVREPVPRTLTIAGVRPHKGAVLVKFAEVDNRTAAELLRGVAIQVPTSDLVPLPEGEFYRFKLLGLEVVTVDGQTLGVVEDILETGANDVLVVTPAEPGRRRPILIPTTHELIDVIDLSGGIIRVQVLPGLLEV